MNARKDCAPGSQIVGFIVPSWWASTAGCAQINLSHHSIAGKCSTRPEHGRPYTVAIMHETSIVLALILSKLLNVLGLLFVNLGEISASIRLRA